MSEAASLPASHLPFPVFSNNNVFSLCGMPASETYSPPQPSDPPLSFVSAFILST